MFWVAGLKQPIISLVKPGTVPLSNAPAPPLKAPVPMLPPVIPAPKAPAPAFDITFAAKHPPNKHAPAAPIPPVTAPAKAPFKTH